MTQRHRVFVSYHHANDQLYKKRFRELFHGHTEALIDESVEDGDIDGAYLTAERIRQKIRDEYLRDTTVTIVLIGAETWKRKHIDWEIGSSLRQTKRSSRSGLIGILLPSYPGYESNQYNTHTIPPRLNDNVACGYAKIYRWSRDPEVVKRWIHDAFLRRSTNLPDNSRVPFAKNRTGDRWWD